MVPPSVTLTEASARLAATPDVKRSATREAQDAVAWLKRHGTKRGRDGMARYAIPSDKAFGVSVGAIQQLGKRLGQDHDLAAALWKTGWYEARMLAAFVDEPERVTVAQMDRWCRDFDNWAICDTRLLQAVRQGAPRLGKGHARGAARGRSS